MRVKKIAIVIANKIAKESLVNQVSTKEPYMLNLEGGDVQGSLDSGAKSRDNYDGLFLSNGPGNSIHCMH